jgi:hypothetical protein
LSWYYKFFADPVTFNAITFWQGDSLGWKTTISHSAAGGWQYGTPVHDVVRDTVAASLGIVVPEPATIIVWSVLGAGVWLGMRVSRRRQPMVQQR